MKSKEHTAAGGGGTGPALGVPGAGPGERLPVAPRERKPALAALAALLILVGALGATVLVLRAGNKIEAIEVTQPIAQGQNIPVSAVQEVDVASGTAIDYVPWSQRGELASYRAGTNLVAGTVLVGQMLTQDSALASGKVLVGLSLRDGQYPVGLKAGDTVAAYLVSTNGTDSSATGSSSGSGSGKSSGGSGSGSGNLLTASATVQSATPSSSSTGVSSGNLPVTLVVNQSDAAALTQAASAGQVALVIVPGGGSGN